MDFKAKINQAAPYILFGGGVVSTIGALAAAIRATTKLGYILDEYNAEKDDIEEIYEDERKEENLGEQMALSIRKKAERHNNIVCVGKVARLYAPAIALTGLSIGCYTASVGILRGRYLAAQTALTGLTEAFDAYRERVIEAEGEDKDREYLYGVKKEKKTIENPETGKKEKVDVFTGEVTGPYTYKWEKHDPQTGLGSTQWDASPTLGHATIVGRIKVFQANLDSGKEVRMSVLLDDLGFEDRRVNGYSEAIAGWRPGDVIKCGLEPTATMTEDAYDFVIGLSNEVTLTFNCRPDIFGITDRPQIEAKVDKSRLLETVVEEGESDE